MPRPKKSRRQPPPSVMLRVDRRFAEALQAEAARLAVSVPALTRSYREWFSLLAVGAATFHPVPRESHEHQV